MGLNANSPDYSNYERMFYMADTSEYAEIEIGYRLFCIIFRNIGLSYQQFRMVLAFIYIILAYKIAIRMTNNVNFALSLFLICPFLSQISGLRFSLAALIVCNSIPNLLENGKKGLTKYTVGILIAALFHYSTLFYLVFIYARKKFSIKKLLVVLSIMVVLALLIKNTSFILSIVQSITSNSRFSQWLSMADSSVVIHLNLTGIFANAFFIVGMFFLSKIVVSVLIKNDSINQSSLSKIDQQCRRSGGLLMKDRRAFDLIINMNLLALLIIPGFIITSEYIRLFYGILMFNYCVFAEAAKGNIFSRKLKYALISPTAVLWTALILWFYTYQFTSHDVFAALTGNLLFN